MTRVSNTDQVLLLLRQQLQRLSDRKETRRTKKTDSAGRIPQAAIARVKALAQLEDLGSDEFERSFIQGLLIDEFGEGLVNDPRFQRLVDQVHQIINSDAESRRLLKSARIELLG